MKFMHISDLHIGKKVNEFSMLDDQKAILSEILGIVDETDVEAVVIAGDIYDRGVPPLEAVELFDSFLTALSNKGKIVLMISGNHDAPERIAFASNILDKDKIYISPVFDGKVKKVKLNDKYGNINFFLLPFIKPAVVRRFYPEAQIESYNDAINTILESIDINTFERNVLVCHQFVTGALRCDSEEVSIGGLDNIDSSLFSKFDYTALGHIHGAQFVSKENIRYCGTPLKYSFSESHHKKGVLIVELNEKNNIKIDKILLHPIRDMREIKGTYDELMSMKNYTEKNRFDYLHVTLTNEEEIPNAYEILREVYPNIMRFDYDNIRSKTHCDTDFENISEMKSPFEIFNDFYKLQNGTDLNKAQSEFIKHVIDGIGGNAK
ncbi:MAG: exonuclease SbcCD subunit D [Clostridia bacterium]|jgi:exonuclease SbcD|nr:exonuclease SbcCD subunit D [Clostridia bacterium]MCI2001198.1 exonuclease SbcCD subunit D [Clostridia bacterium]MCI2015888.1 exonuclease SbcCD subunit D [Clostridia bacterium]